MRRQVRGLLALALAVGVVAVGVVLARRSSGERPLPDPATSTAPAVTAVTVRLAGRVTLTAAGDALVVDLPVRSDAPVPVSISAPRPGRGFRPAGALTMSPGSTAVLQLRWDGPDCRRDVPDRILGDLALSARLPGRTVVTVLDTGPADVVLRESWVTGCAIEPTPDAPTTG